VSLGAGAPPHHDAAVTPTLINQGIGLPAAPAGLEPYDGAVP
jgi:hypothetical protein